MTLPIQIDQALKEVHSFQNKYEMTRCCSQAVGLFKALTKELPYDIKVVSGVIKHKVENREYEIEHTWATYEGEIIEVVPEWYKKKSRGKVRYITLEEWIKQKQYDNETKNITINQCVALKKVVKNLESYTIDEIKECMFLTTKVSNQRMKHLRDECKKRRLQPTIQNLSFIEEKLQREMGQSYFTQDYFTLRKNNDVFVFY